MHGQSPKSGPWAALRVALGLCAVLTLAAPDSSALAPPSIFGGAVDAPIKATVGIDALVIEPGGVGSLPIRLDFPSTHHLNSQPAPMFVIAEPPGVKAGQVAIQGESHEDPVLDVQVYEGVITLFVEVAASDSLRGEYTLKGKLTYYPCSDVDQVCFEKVDPIQVLLIVEPHTEAVAPSTGGAVALSPAHSPLRSGGSGALAERITGAFDRSVWLAYLLVFLGGILASFTPCVYPMIPITVAVIGAGSAGSKRRGFQLSLIYVLGIAVAYSTLGAVAAATGRAFGTLTQTFGVLLGIGALLALLGASMLGFFEIQPPAFLSRLQSKQGKGTIGILLMGAATGLVASPCLGPVLLALLAWIAKTGDVFRGFTLLFVFALGMGVLLIAIGTFAGVLTALPKSGAWMVRVREILGLILVGAGVYYIGLALANKGIPQKATWTVVAGVALMVTGFLARGSQRSPADVAGTGPAGVRELKVWLRKGLGVAMMVAGGYAVIVGLSQAGLTPSWMQTGTEEVPGTMGEGIDWTLSYEYGIEEARGQSKPVMIDFYADWCVYCKKLDSDVFADDRVVGEAGRFVAVRVDADERPDLARDHGVLGLPTIVFLDSNGDEAGRIESYVKADEFLGMMTLVR
jgi:thiol:disulfide interchange protein DsbD